MGATRFCLEPGTGLPHLCTGTVQDCDPADQDHCLAAGVPWTCPPGFVAEPAVAVAPGALPACKPDPGSCPEDPFGGIEDTADGKTVFVDPSFTGTSTGKRAAPFKAMTTAVQAVGSGGTVVLAAGLYPSTIFLHAPLTVRGRCSALVAIQGSAAGAVVAIKSSLAGGTVSLSGVHIQAAGHAGLLVEGDVQAELDDVWIDGAEGVGLHLQFGGRARLRRSVVSGVVNSAPGARGLQAEQLADVELEDARITGSVGFGIYATGPGTRIRAERVLIDGTKVQPKVQYTGRGVEVHDGARVELVRARVSGNHGVGIGAWDPVTVVSARGVIVDGTLPAENDRSIGLYAMDGASLTLAGVRVSGARGLGVVLNGAGPPSSASGLVVDAIVPAAGSDHIDSGIQVLDGARMMARSVRVSGAVETGVLVDGGGTRLEIQDLTVDGTLPDNGTGGYGVRVFRGAVLLGERLHLADNTTFGLLAEHPGSRVDASGLEVQRTRAQPDTGDGGCGVGVGQGARVDLADALLANDVRCGVLAAGPGTRLTAQRVAVLQAAAVNGGQLPRVGLVAQDSAEADWQDVRIDGAWTVGIHAIGQETRAAVRDAAVVLAGGQPTSVIGLASAEGAGLLASQVRVAVSGGVGAVTSGGPSRLDLIGARIVANSASAAGQAGRGIAVQGGGRARLSGVAISTWGDRGLWVAGEGSEVLAHGLAAARSVASPQSGPVLSVAAGARLELHAARVADAWSHGVLVLDAHATLADCLLLGGAAVPGPGRGAMPAATSAHGIVGRAAELTIRRTAVAGFAGAAAVLNECPSVSLDHSLLTGARWGLVLQESAPGQVVATVIEGGEADVAHDLGLPAPAAPDPIPVAGPLPWPKE